MNRAATAQADAIAAELFTPDALQKIEQTLQVIRDGGDAELAVRFLYGMAYMEGMISMAKVGAQQ